MNLKVLRSVSAGDKALVILVSRAFLDMARDCKGTILLEAVESDLCKRSSLVSVFPRFSSVSSEARSRVFRSEHADSSLRSVVGSSSNAMFFGHCILFPLGRMSII